MTISTSSPNSISSLAEAVEQHQLKDLAPILQVLAKKVLLHRSEHKGLVPSEALESCCTIGGSTTSFELVLIGPSGIWLKMRGREEVGWQGLYQLPCTQVRRHEKQDQVLARLLKAPFGDRAPSFVSKASCVGTHVHYMEERNATAANIVWRCDIMADDEAGLRDADLWKPVSQRALEHVSLADLSWIVPHHARMLLKSGGVETLPFIFVDL